MSLDKEKLIKAREILGRIANGVNPINGESIEKDSFLQDPRIIRCLFFIQEVLSEAIEGKLNTYSKRPQQFSITEEEKSRVELSNGRIGVNEFAKCINKVIDLNRSKRLTGKELNKQLKKMGILSEQQLPDGKKKTVMNDKSKEYGIETELRSYNGTEYEMILFNDIGKKYLLDNIEEIMRYNE